MHIRQTITLLLATALSGCSSQGLYYTGQAWRRSLCDEMRGDDRVRCLSEASKSYGEYHRENSGTSSQK
jgi:hypothetical protein